MECKSTRLLKLRKSKRMTQAQLAEIVGVSRVAIGNWESDPDVEIGGEKLLKLADALDVSPYLIIFGKDKEPRKIDSTLTINNLVTGLFDFVISGEISIRKGADPSVLAQTLFDKALANSEIKFESPKIHSVSIG